MANALEVFRLGAVGARNGAKLRLEVVVSNPANPVTINYPTFYASSETTQVVQENGFHCINFWKNGPGVRHGQWAWLQTDPFTLLLTTPNVYPQGYPPVGWHSSITDAHATRNAVLLARDRSTNLQTDLQADWDNYEITGTTSAPSGANQVYRECDEFTLSFITQAASGPAIWHRVNTTAEIPPLQMLPRKARDAAYGETGDYENRTYSFAQEKRHIISPTMAAGTLTDASDASVGSYAGSVLGWTDWIFNPVIDNTETGWKVKSGTTQYASVRPFSGFSCILLNASELPPVAYSVSRTARHARAYVRDGTLRLGFAENVGYPWADVDTGKVVTSVAIDYSRAGRADKLRVCVCESGSVKVYETTTEDGVLALAITVGTGTHGAIAQRPDGILHTYRLDSGTVYARAYDAQGNAIYAEQTTNLTGLDNAEIDAHYSVRTGGEAVIGMVYLVSGTVTYKTSEDGISFS
jgi:hypothetical protein